MRFTLFTLIMPILVFPFRSFATQDLPIAKLTCSGSVYLDNQRYDLKDGFVDINKTIAQISGFGIPDGKYEVILKTVREDSLSIKNINKPLILGTINRISGRAFFYEIAASGNVKDGKTLFIGDCQTAKRLF